MSKGRRLVTVAVEGLGPLIERLGPLNNRWRDSGATGKVLTLWDMGDVLLDLAGDPSDALLWEIQQRSYITRNVLRYALIVRRSWDDRAFLHEVVGHLSSYSVFREALPFLKGNREGIDEATYLQVLSCLSGRRPADATRYLRGLKAEVIGRKHRKGVTVRAVRDLAARFSRAADQLEADASVSAQTPAETDGVLVSLSRLVMAAAAGDQGAEAPSPMPSSTVLAELAEALVAATQRGRGTLSAFRKLVGAARLMETADLLNSMRSKSALDEWQRRRGIRLSLGPGSDRRV